MGSLYPFILSSPLNEPPNILSLLHTRFESSWWAFILYDWEDIIFSSLLAIFIALIFHIGVRNRQMIPTGLQNFLEFITESVLSVLRGILGQDGTKYLPFIGTLFVYIFGMNLMGLIPLLKPPSASLNITIALGICVFLYVQYLNVKHMGFKGFLYHMAGSPKSKLEWGLVPLMFPLELLTQLSRPLTLALRLFGNIMGEEALIGYFTLMGVVALSFFELPVNAGIPLQIPFMLLGMLTSLMQAAVFSLLTAVYIMLSMPHGEKEH